MKRACYFLVCLTSLLAGLGAGHFAWTREENGPAKRRSVAKETGKTAAPGWRVSARALAGPRGAAMILAMAARRENDKLPALIEAAANDRAALEFLADMWLRSDPAAFALAMVESNAMKGSQREGCSLVLSEMMAKWGKMEPDKAWETAERFSDRLLRRWNLSQLGTVRMKSDPQAGLEFILRHPGVIPTGAATENLAGRRDLAPLIQQLPDSTTKAYTLKSALKGVPVAEAMAVLNQQKDYSTSIARRLFLRQAAETSLEEVMAYHAQASGPDRYASAVVVGETLARQDAPAAVEWARTNLSGAMRSLVIRKAAEALAKTDPAAAKEARALLPESYKAEGK